jgi:transposase
MPMKCSICSHRKRAAIETALLEGMTCGKIAQRFRVGQWAVYRHQRQHVAAQLQKARELQESAGGTNLVAQLREIHRTTQRILSRALAKNDGELALRAIARLEKQLELEGRLLGELEDRGTTVQRVEVVYIDKAVIASPAPVPNAQQAIEPGAPLRLGAGAPTRNVSADLPR